MTLEEVHMALWCVGWVGGRRRKIPLGQFHSNNEVFEPVCVASTSHFNGHPLPPSVGRQYYNTGRRTAAIAASAWQGVDKDHSRAAAAVFMLRIEHIRSKDEQS